MTRRTRKRRVLKDFHIVVVYYRYVITTKYREWRTPVGDNNVIVLGEEVFSKKRPIYSLQVSMVRYDLSFQQVIPLKEMFKLIIEMKKDQLLTVILLLILHATACPINPQAMPSSLNCVQNIVCT